jgi:hypothetical protein
LNYSENLLHCGKISRWSLIDMATLCSCELQREWNNNWKANILQKKESGKSVIMKLLKVFRLLSLQQPQSHKHAWDELANRHKNNLIRIKNNMNIIITSYFTFTIILSVIKYKFIQFKLCQHTILCQIMKIICLVNE